MPTRFPEDDDVAKTRCCVTCGAVITKGTTVMHNQWHDRLNRRMVAADRGMGFVGVTTDRRTGGEDLMADVSEAQKNLIVQTAQDLRKAITERNRLSADVIAEYDEAVELGDEDEIQARGLVMVVMVGLCDPTRDVLSNYAQVSQLLRSAEAG